MADQILVLSGSVEELKIADLKIDPSYQRGLKPGRKKIKKNFNPSAVGTLHVGRRADGSLWLVDGQQRHWAMTQLGIEKWQCFVISSSGSRYEADVFNKLNGGRTSLHSKELFRAAVEGKDPAALALIRACESAGLKLHYMRGGTNNWPHLSGIAGLYRAIGSHGEELISHALAVLAKTWPRQDDAVANPLVMGMIALYVSHGDVIDDDRMTAVLGKVPPRAILNDAKVMMGFHNSNVAKVIAGHYNKRLSVKKRINLFEADQTEEVA